ncbi:hypothetical protein HN011_002461 [Eciton burchellii]|nr:hypothetical protein HN011_002461 [Eciton burchellii]
MEGGQSEGVARIVPSQQNRADDLAHSVWDLKLADSDPSSSHPIHFLLRSNLFPSIFVRKSPRLEPTDALGAQNTIFGWILSGPTGIAPHDTNRSHVSLRTIECDINNLLRKFWEDEEISEVSSVSYSEVSSQHGRRTV